MSSWRVQKVGHWVQTGSGEKQWQRFRTTPEEDLLLLALLFSSKFSAFPSFARKKTKLKEKKRKEKKKKVE